MICRCPSAFASVCKLLILSDCLMFLFQHPTTSTKVTCSGHIATQTSASITTATPSSTSNITAFSAGATVLFPHPHSMTPLSLNTNAFSDISPKLSSSSLLRARSQHDLDPLRFNSRPQEVSNIFCFLLSSVLYYYIFRDGSGRSLTYCVSPSATSFRC